MLRCRHRRDLRSSCHLQRTRLFAFESAVLPDSLCARRTALKREHFAVVIVLSCVVSWRAPVENLYLSRASVTPCTSIVNTKDFQGYFEQPEHSLCGLLVCWPPIGGTQTCLDN